MVKIPLVGELIQDGKRLIDLLEADGLAVTSAFWLFDEDDDKWSLVIALPFVDENGPLPAYQRLPVLMEQSDSWLALDPGFVSFWGPNEWRFQKLRDRAESAEHTPRNRYRGALPTVVLDDSYVYRLQPAGAL